jgi:hypothetical protein
MRLIYLWISECNGYPGHVERRGIGYWWEIQKERDHWEDQDIGGWTILKWIMER